MSNDVYHDTSEETEGGKRKEGSLSQPEGTKIKGNLIHFFVMMRDP